MSNSMWKNDPSLVSDATTSSLVTAGNVLAQGISDILRNFKTITQQLSRHSFSSSSSLRVDCAGSTVGLVTTVTTVTTVATGNVGFGDMGKAATAQLVSQQLYNVSTRRNLVES